MVVEVSTMFDSTDDDGYWHNNNTWSLLNHYGWRGAFRKYRLGPFNTHIESDNIIYFETNHHYITSKWTKNGEVWEKSNIGNYTSINEVGGSELINKYTSNNYYKYDDIFVNSVDEKYLIFYNLIDYDNIEIETRYQQKYTKANYYINNDPIYSSVNTTLW